MRTSSHAAVMSPEMSTMLVAAPASRTSMVTIACGIPLPPCRSQGHVADGGRLVREDLHEVGKPGDLEDLAVVVGQATRGDRPLVLPGLREDPHDQRDAGRVDVVDVAEVQQDRSRAVPGRLVVGAETILLNFRS